MLALSLPLVLAATVKLVTNVRDLSAGQVGCPYAQRCWLALELKGVPYVRVEIDLRAKPQWLLQVSPLGRVPALIADDEHAVVESTVINEFLEEAFPELGHPVFLRVGLPAVRRWRRNLHQEPRALGLQRRSRHVRQDAQEGGCEEGRQQEGRRGCSFRSGSTTTASPTPWWPLA